MEEIKDTIQEVMRALEGKKKASPLDNPQVLLERTLSAKELKHIKPHYFKKGILSINVDSSSWLYQFNLKKADLLAQLGKQTAKIRDIRFRLGGTR